MLFKQEQLHR